MVVGSVGPVVLFLLTMAWVVDSWSIPRAFRRERTRRRLSKIIVGSHHEVIGLGVCEVLEVGKTSWGGRYAGEFVVRVWVDGHKRTITCAQWLEASTPYFGEL